MQHKHCAMCLWRIKQIKALSQDNEFLADQLKRAKDRNTFLERELETLQRAIKGYVETTG